MHVTSERLLDDGVVERRSTFGKIPGIVWTSENTPGPLPLILMGHPGGLRQMYPGC